MVGGGMHFYQRFGSQTEWWRKGLGFKENTHPSLLVCSKQEGWGGGRARGGFIAPDSANNVFYLKKLVFRLNAEFGG